MASVSKCCQCEDITEQLLGICVECVESIMKSLNDPIREETLSQVSPTTTTLCVCNLNNIGAKEKVDFLVKNCDVATKKMNQRNIDETKRRKATKS
tara:strand:- start:52 stop:339 length:288 start_codon:yes stop_codon:yes gene_type:complete